MDSEILDNIERSRPELDCEPTCSTEVADVLQSTVQDFYVAGASLSRMDFWNKVLITTSILLCVLQCIVSGLLLSKLNEFPLWPGYRLQIFDIWFPEVLGGLVGIGVGSWCHRIIYKAKDVAQRVMKSSHSLSYQKPYIPWVGSRETVSKMALRWTMVVPTLFSFGIFVISGLAFAASVRVVQVLQSVDDVEADHALGVVLLCFHLSLLICRGIVFVLSALIPLIISVITRTTWSKLASKIYPFAIFLEHSRGEKPLLIDS